jgi:hypothetical protein
VREKHQLQSESQGNIIKDIRQQLEKAQEEIAQKKSDDSRQWREKAEALEIELREKDAALLKEGDSLREEIRTLENQLPEVCQRRHNF